MSFSDENLKHVLIVTSFGTPRRPDRQKFKLSGFMRVYDPSDGSGTFMQPLPSDTDQLIGITFDSVEFVPPVSNSAEGGDYTMTHYHADMKVGKRSGG